MTMTRRSLLTPAAMCAVVLTMLSLNQVFVRQRWLFPSLLGVGIAFFVGWAGRRLDVPGILAPALSVLALVTFLGITFHAGTTAWGIPTGTTMRAIGESLRQSGRDLTELAAPAEATNALTLLATTGVFFVAVLVDIFVFRLRRPVAAGVPLLALFLIPTSLAPKGNAVAFVLAAAGYLCLLVAEGRDRARAWGRRLSGIDRLDEVSDVSHVARVGRRIGTAAVGLALAIPVALPSVGDGMFSGSGSGPFGRGGGGSSTVTVISPIVEIRTQLQSDQEHDLLTVRVEGMNDYLRLTSLDEFNGSEWKLVQQRAGDDNKVGADDPIPQPVEHGGIRTDERVLEVEVGPLAVQWLPVPYAPLLVDVKGTWKYDKPTLAVFSPKTGKTSQNVSFRVTSKVPSPTPEQLRAGGAIPDEIERRYLSVPSVTPRIAEAALGEATSGAQNPYDIAVALQEFFQKKGGFKYNLQVPPGTGSDALETFLTRREGYCEQFAATMAYLARLAGIPARVAVGFTGGVEVGDDVWRVTNRDAHAWPELYFPNVGWVRFEPTPRGDNRATRPGYAPPPNIGIGNPGDPTPGPTDSPSSEPTASPSGGPRQREEADDQEQPAGPTGPLGRATRRGIAALPLVLALMAVAGATPTVVGYGVRRRRRALATSPAGRTHAAWDSLADAAEDAGYPLRSSDSPRASARRLVTAAGLAPDMAGEVSRLASAEERARYARTAPPVDGLEASARSVRRALMASLPRWSRLRAQVFPASSMRRIRRAFGAANEWTDRSRTAMRARMGSAVRRLRPS